MYIDGQPRLRAYIRLSCMIQDIDDLQGHGARTPYRLHVIQRLDHVHVHSCCYAGCSSGVTR